MCTVTWWRRGSFYELYFNRDELKSRLPGLPPTIRPTGGVHYISPTDGDYGGTWIWVNEHRLTACLLNHYPSDFPNKKNSTPYASRGSMLRDLASSDSLENLKRRFEQMPLERYRPFYLIALQPDPPAVRWTWNGTDLKCRDIEDDDLPLTTSSFQTERIVEERVAQYRRRISKSTAPTEIFFKDYHYSESSSRDAVSVCMEREDAQTVSMSRITVSEANIVFSYRGRLAQDADFVLEPVETVLALSGESN